MIQATGTANPKVAFLPTASGEPDSYIATFYPVFLKLGCHPSHLTFFKRTPELRAYLLAQNMIYVGGGNTKSMLAIWREWGVVEILRLAWESGVVLAGVSAGAICWFQQGVTDSWAGNLRPIDGLGLLPGSCCPHYDGEPNRRPTYNRLVAAGEISAGFGIDDGAALHFIDGKLRRVVGSRPGARVWDPSRLVIIPDHYIFTADGKCHRNIQILRDSYDDLRAANPTAGPDRSAQPRPAGTRAATDYEDFNAANGYNPRQ